MEQRTRRAATLPHRQSQQQSQPTATSLSRPASYYDNVSVSTNGLVNENGGNGATLPRRLQQQSFSQTNGNAPTKIDTPSQTVLLNTTVPQNIGGSNLATRHTPTRSSLRHSRMIVMSRTGKVPRKSMPHVMRYHRLAKALVGLQTLLASALCFLAMWLLIWAPNLKTRDNPYWSGIPLMLSGLLGLILLCCCRKDYPGMSHEYSLISTKVISIVITTIAGATCLIASAFAIIHLVSLSNMTCSPPNQLNSTCYCKIPSELNQSQSIPALIKSYHYVDLSCPEVDNILNILLIFSCATNGIAGIISLWYVYLHWASRYYYTYSKVRTEESRKRIVLTNT